MDLTIASFACLASDLIINFEDNDLWPEVGTGVNEGTAPRGMKTEDDEMVEGEPGENISELLC